MNNESFDKKQEYNKTDDVFSFAQSEADGIKKKIDDRKKKQKRVRSIIVGLSVLVGVLSVVTSYSLYMLYVNTTTQEELVSGAGNTTTQKSQPKTADEIVLALSKHILLPDGVPQIAEVKDVEKLRTTQAFFKDAQNGDVVVVYNGKTIILYRPGKDIVVAEGDISGQGESKP